MTDESISIDTGTDELLCAIRDRVAVITLNRPEARNSLSDHLTPALRRMIKRNGDDPDVGALLIAGAGSSLVRGRRQGFSGDGPAISATTAAINESARRSSAITRDNMTAPTISERMAAGCLPPADLGGADDSCAICSR